MTAPKDLADYLEDQAIGTVDTDIFAHFLQDAPGTVICLAQYAGDPIDKVADIEYPQVQVKVRAATPEDALNKLEDVRGVLHKLWEETINGHRYLYVSASSSPAYLGTTKLDRYTMHLFTMNFSVVKELE